MNDELASYQQTLLRKGIVSMIFCCLIMSLPLFLLDSDELVETIGKVRWENLLWAGFLALSVYMGRFVKWMFFVIFFLLEYHYRKIYQYFYQD